MNDRVKEYIDLVVKLFSQIRGFLEGTDLVIETSEITITEKKSGAYKAPSLTIHSEGRAIVTIIPVGTYFIMSKGVVNIGGIVGSESLAFLDKNGLHIYDIEEDGWYWVGGGEKSGAELLSKGLLFALISAVSDYEFKLDRNRCDALLARGEKLFGKVIHDLNSAMAYSFSNKEFANEPDYRTISSFKEICIALALYEEKLNEQKSYK
jgi:hypothetical protein